MADRRMVYPYTLGAKIANFPYKFYFNNSGYYRHYIYAIFWCFPIFWSIQKSVNSEANQETYRKYLEKERHEMEHHRDHLL